MNVLINITMIVLLTLNFGYAQTMDSIAAEYCLGFDADKVWKLLRYEQFVPLAIKIQTKSYDYNHTISADLEADIKFSTSFLKKIWKNKNDKEVKKNE